jgi:hypothetical protein
MGYRTIFLRNDSCIFWTLFIVATLVAVLSMAIGSVTVGQTTVKSERINEDNDVQATLKSVAKNMIDYTKQQKPEVFVGLDSDKQANDMHDQIMHSVITKDQQTLMQMTQLTYLWKINTQILYGNITLFILLVITCIKNNN